MQIIIITNFSILSYKFQLYQGVHNISYLTINHHNSNFNSTSKDIRERVHKRPSSDDFINSFVDSVISLTGFALVGGPARQDHPKAIETLRKLDVPYLVALPLVFQTTEERLNSNLGLHPIQVALPELDGGMEPIVFSGRDPRTGKSHALHKRVEQLCTRAVRWAELKRKPKTEKKVAITVFSFPPDINIHL